MSEHREYTLPTPIDSEDEKLDNETMNETSEQVEKTISDFVENNDNPTIAGKKQLLLEEYVFTRMRRYGMNEDEARERRMSKAAMKNYLNNYFT